MSSLKKEMLHGVFWSAIEKYSSLFVSIIVSMVLARILSPAEYGVVAIATVIITFLQMFCTMGIGPAIIQHRDLTVDNINSIFTFCLSVGALLSVLFFCSSWTIADFYGNTQLIPICQLLAIQLFFATANMVPNALMAKNKRFKEIAKRTLVLQFISGASAIIAARNGAGVYSLLITPVFSSVAIFFWNQRYYRVKIDRKYNLEPIKRIFGFSFYQFLFEFVNYFSRNMDKLIIGKFMNIDALGIYEKSYRLMQLPMQNITSVINPVLQPVLKELQDDKRDLSCKYNKIVRFVATISFPTGVILSGMAKEVIHIFYGRRWDEAIPIFSILALSLPLQMILSTSGSIYMVCNNTKMQFKLGLRNTLTTVLGFLVAAFVFGTLEAMAWAWTITLAVNFIFTYFLMYRYVLCTSVIPMLREILWPFLSALFVAGILYVLSCMDCTGGIITSILIKGCSSIVLTLICVQLSGNYNIIKLVKLKFRKN